MFDFIKKLFTKKPIPIDPKILSLTIENTKINEDLFSGFIVDIKTSDSLINFIRNGEFGIEIANHSDQELAHLLFFKYCQHWISKNLKSSLFIETHSFLSSQEIKYERIWNQAFITSIANIGFDEPRGNEEALVDSYMSYTHGVRMVEEQEATMNSEAVSPSHPQLSESHRLQLG